MRYKVVKRFILGFMNYHEQWDEWIYPGELIEVENNSIVVIDESGNRRESITIPEIEFFEKQGWIEKIQ